MTNKRKDCPMRHENGNCTVAGGFCTAVSGPVCEALHNAFNCGYRSAIRQQEHFREATKKMEPLNLDELRQMDGEPVWWWNKSAKPVCTICVWDRFMNEPMFANYDWQSEDALQLTKYKRLKKCGYKPYRQKPEEGTV